MAMGGVGEAMLLGAAMGGGSAALTGGDPLKGALLGGLTGGAGAGIGGALGGAGAAGTEAALATAGTELGTQAATNTAMSQLGTQAGTAGTQAATSFALPNAATTSGLPGALPNAAALPSGAGSVNYALGAPSVAPGAGAGSVNYALNAPSMAPGVGTGGISNLAPATSAATPANLFADPMKYMGEHKFLTGASALAGAVGGRETPEGPEEYNGPLKRFRFNPNTYRPAMYAEGGIAALGAEGYDRMVGEEPMYQAMARGGISDLGGYSDYARGGRMLKGPGDGMSDSIPGVIGGKRPARLADGEFVVPADVVSHLGNGSTDAGAKHLYSMMDKVRQARTGRKAQGREINPRKYVPA